MTISRLSHFGSKLLCIGHRGARAFAPENTLAAIQRAAELGCDMIEIDVHLSRDDVPVVHHDDRLDRCTNVAECFPDRASAFLSEFTFDELRQLDAGSWYLHQLILPAEQRQPFLRSLSDAEIASHVQHDHRMRFGNGQVWLPSLAEALECARALSLAVNVEIKSIPRMYPGIAAKVIEEIAHAGMRNRVIVSSFDHQKLLEIRQLDAELPIGVLTSDRLARPECYLELLDADAYHPGCCDEFDSIGFGSVNGQIDIDCITAVRKSGRSVFAWTCNDPVEMRTLATANVSGIVTDYPNRFPRNVLPYP